MRKLNIGDSMIINGGALKGRKGYITEVVQNVHQRTIFIVWEGDDLNGSIQKG